MKVFVHLSANTAVNSETYTSLPVLSSLDLLFWPTHKRHFSFYYMKSLMSPLCFDHCIQNQRKIHPYKFVSQNVETCALLNVIIEINYQLNILGANQKIRRHRTPSLSPRMAGTSLLSTYIIHLYCLL